MTVGKLEKISGLVPFQSWPAGGVRCASNTKRGCQGLGAWVLRFATRQPEQFAHQRRKRSSHALHRMGSGATLRQILLHDTSMCSCPDRKEQKLAEHLNMSHSPGRKQPTTRHPIKLPVYGSMHPLKAKECPRSVYPPLQHLSLRSVLCVRGLENAQCLELLCESRNTPMQNVIPTSETRNSASY